MAKLVEDQQRIQEELDRVCESPEFRQSEQSKRMLRYLTEKSVAENWEALRERFIGVELFGLQAGFDTNENPIVRVRANEVRKRLAKYYLRSGKAEVELRIPAGAYRVEVKRDEPEQKRSGRWWIGLGVLAAVVVAVIAALTWRGLRSEGELETFWKPVFQSSRPVILCSGHPVVYRLGEGLQRRLLGQGYDHYRMQTEMLRLPAGELLKAEEVVAMPNQYIGLGSAEAVARVHGWLGRRGKDSDIRFGNDITFSDLRQSPAVFVGAFQNQWTRQFLNGLRFRFESVGGSPVVVDTKERRTWSLPQLKQNGETDEDYVLLTRVLKGPSGEFMVLAAGITQYGGHTVGEALTKPEVMKELTKGAEVGWGGKNLQLLLHVKVIGQTAGPPELVALHQW